MEAPELLGDTIPMHSIITFSDRCTLKNVQVTSSDIHVINRGEVKHIVAAICSNGNASLSEEQIQDLYNHLYPYSQVDATVKEKHVAGIEQTVHHETVKPIEMPAPVQTPKEILAAAVEPDQVVIPQRCPRCGGALVLRTAKKGSNAGNRFYGCASFPKCRYIRNV